MSTHNPTASLVLRVMLACRLRVEICIGDELGRSMGRPASCLCLCERDWRARVGAKGIKPICMMIANSSWPCMCRSNGWPQGGLDRSAIELRQNRELPLVEPRRDVVWKLRLGPMYLTTRSASLELGLPGTRQKAGLRCGAMLSWIVLAFSRTHARTLV